MRIGVNALYLIPGCVGGTEIYLRSLLNALGEIDSENEYIVFTNRETDEDLASPRPNFRCSRQPVRATNRPARIVWEQTGLPVTAARESIDVLFNPGFTTPLLCPCPTVTVFHDLQHKRYPEYFRWFDRPAWRLCLFQAACSSDTLIAVSQATRNDLLRYYPIPASKVLVVPHGVDERLFDIGRQRQGSEPEPYLLCVSTLHPHKNLERLIRVFAKFRRQRPEFRLVLAGMRGFHASAIERLVSDLNLNAAVKLTGWIPREALYELYLHSHSCVYPSTFEGFGLPVLESMAAGIPTACSAIDPLLEVAGDAAVLFEPANQHAILKAMLAVTDDDSLRRRLAREGPRRAARFSWKETAEATLEALRMASDQRE